MERGNVGQSCAALRATASTGGIRVCFAGLWPIPTGQIRVDQRCALVNDVVAVSEFYERWIRGSSHGRSDFLEESTC